MRWMRLERDGKDGSWSVPKLPAYALPVPTYRVVLWYLGGQLRNLPFGKQKESCKSDPATNDSCDSKSREWSP